MRSANNNRGIGRGRGGAPSISTSGYADPRSHTSGSRMESNSRVGSAYSSPAMPLGRGRGVSNQPAWRTVRHPSNISPETNRLPIGSSSSNGSYRAIEKGNNSISRTNDFTNQTRQEPWGTTKHPQPVRESTYSPSVSGVLTIARNDTETSNSLLTVTNVSSDTDNPQTQPETESEEDVQELENVADQFLRNFNEDEDHDATEEQLKRAREERKRRIQQQYAQQHGEPLFVEENMPPSSQAKRNRGLDNATIESSSTIDGIMTNKQYSSPSDLDRENQYTTKVHGKDPIDGILDGTNSDDGDDDDDAFDMFADDDTNRIDKLQAKIMQSRQAPQQHTVTTDAANYDDAEGYYRPTIGEYLGPLGQYRVLGNTGKVSS